MKIKLPGLLQPAHGFTLIELLVVVGIIAVLIGIGTVSYTKAQSSARDVKRKSDLADVKKALYNYRADKGKFCLKDNCDVPGDPYYDQYATNGCDSLGWTSSPNFGFGIQSLKQRLLDGGYMKAPVYDPQYSCDTSKSYLYQINNDTFVISAYLENPSTNVGCSPYSGRNYCITE